MDKLQSEAYITMVRTFILSGEKKNVVMITKAGRRRDNEQARGKSSTGD